jgi:Rod binding domain-containing protein
MLSEVPLVGSMATGFGGNDLQGPRANQPNIEEASQQFVSMLYSYMFQQMRESGADEEEGLFSGPHANMLMGFLDQEIGQKLAKSEGSGLADTLMQQLKTQDPSLNIDSASTPSESSESPAFATLTESGNLIKEMMQKDVTPDAFNPSSIDNSQQIMGELYKLNRRE